MRRSVLTLALVSLCGFSVASVVAQNSRANAPLLPMAGMSVDTVDATAEKIDDAVATAVIAAVAGQFAEHDVAVKLDMVQMQVASIQDRTVGGYGQLRMGNDASWIPFRFEALYDTRSAAVSQPRLMLGESHGGEYVAAQADLGAALKLQVNRALRAEFSQQPFDLVVDRVVTQVAGDRLVHVRGTGSVDFGAEGSTATQIDALYDPAEGKWLRVDYELGDATAWADTAIPTVATL